MRHNALAVLAILLPFVFAGVSNGQAPKAEPLDRSVTVYPVVLTTERTVPESFPIRLAEVVGTLLERAGLTTVEIAESPFNASNNKSLEDVSRDFGECVAKDPPATRCAILSEIATDANGISRIGIIVVDRNGKRLFSEQFDRDSFADSPVPPRDPMTACVFIANRLRTVWNLDDPLREGAPQGKMAQRMAERSGLPPATERKAMDRRLARLNSQTEISTISVYPIHLWQGWDHGQAQKLADGLKAKGLFDARVVAETPTWNVKGDPNEQKVLWDTARSFREHLRAVPSQTDYALLVDCGLKQSGTGERTANHVHVVLSTSNGDWVLVDFQNSHHDDFSEFAPKTVQECVRLAQRRLEKRLDANR